MLRFLLALVVSCFSLASGFSAEGGGGNGNHPLEGTWKVVENQIGSSVSYAVIVWDEGDDLYFYTTYTQPGGTQIDSGAIDPVVGGYTVESSQSGGSGTIQHTEGQTYDWQNIQTGAGG